MVCTEYFDNELEIWGEITVIIVLVMSPSPILKLMRNDINRHQIQKSSSL